MPPRIRWDLGKFHGVDRELGSSMKSVGEVKFSALYATADTLAIGACRALKEAGLTVPDDISVAGFDGIDAGEYYI